MPVVAADLLSPTGDLLPSLFAGEDNTALTTRLNGYITKGSDKAAAIADATVRDRAITHYAYYLAYQAIHVRLSGSSASVAIGGDLSRSISSAQIAAFERLRDANLREFNELLPSAPVSGAARPSSAVAADFAW